MVLVMCIIGFSWISSGYIFVIATLSVERGTLNSPTLFCNEIIAIIICNFKLVEKHEHDHCLDYECEHLLSSFTPLKNCFQVKVDDFLAIRAHS